jgi:hypothetical protein
MIRQALKNLLNRVFAGTPMTFLAQTGYCEEEIKTVESAKSDYPG